MDKNVLHHIFWKRAQSHLVCLDKITEIYNTLLVCLDTITENDQTNNDITHHISRYTNWQWQHSPYMSQYIKNDKPHLVRPDTLTDNDKTHLKCLDTFSFFQFNEILLNQSGQKMVDVRLFQVLKAIVGGISYQSAEEVGPRQVVQGLLSALDCSSNYFCIKVVC